MRAFLLLAVMLITFTPAWEQESCDRSARIRLQVVLLDGSMLEGVAILRWNAVVGPKLGYDSKQLGDYLQCAGLRPGDAFTELPYPGREPEGDEFWPVRILDAEQGQDGETIPLSRSEVAIPLFDGVFYIHADEDVTYLKRVEIDRMTFLGMLGDPDEESFVWNDYFVGWPKDAVERLSTLNAGQAMISYDDGYHFLLSTVPEIGDSLLTGLGDFAFPEDPNWFDLALDGHLRAAHYAIMPYGSTFQNAVAGYCQDLRALLRQCRGVSPQDREVVQPMADCIRGILIRAELVQAIAGDHTGPMCKPATAQEMNRLPSAYRNDFGLVPEGHLDELLKRYLNEGVPTRERPWLQPEPLRSLLERHGVYLWDYMSGC